MEKRERIRVGLVVYIVATLAVLFVSISCGWFVEEGRDIRGPIRWAWRHRLYPCGLIRGLPVPDVIVDVPCQVWNLAPLNLVALFAARWLIVDTWRSLTGAERR